MILKIDDLDFTDDLVLLSHTHSHRQMKECKTVQDNWIGFQLRSAIVENENKYRCILNVTDTCYIPIMFEGRHLYRLMRSDKNPHII